MLTRAVRLLRLRWRDAYLAAVLATLVNTFPDVGRKVLVWDDPSGANALLVGVVGVLTALLAQLWVTGALTGLPTGDPLVPRGALRRGTATGLAAVRTAPRTVLAGLLTGGGVSALLTLPVSLAALGPHRLLGPLDRPGVGAFAVAAVSDVVASVVTLPFLALVLVLAAGRGVPAPPQAGRAQA